MSPLYPVHETFHSFQGEGVHAGRAALFIRLYGCDQKCHFCDSAGTWHPAYKPEGIERLSAPQIAERVTNTLGYPLPNADKAFVVLTGGEPCLYDLAPLVEAIQDTWRYVHIETAGHRPIPHEANWVTLSPKFFAKAPLRENWDRADEIKLVCFSPEQMRLDLGRIEVFLGDRRRDWPHIWLHPEWSQRENPDLLGAIVDAVKMDPRLRAGLQMHKYYRADYFDPGTRPDVPLGGVIPLAPVNS